jgi:hypothetical protein
MDDRRFAGAGRPRFGRQARRASMPGIRSFPVVVRPGALLIVAVATFSAACDPPAEAARPDSAVVSTPQRVVDSIRPLEEDLRRFRVGIPVAPSGFTGGAPSREALVRRFLDALARLDTAALTAMALTRAEFAYLTYPSSPYTRPPYRQSPEIVWLLLRAEHEKGMTRLVPRLGRQRAEYVGHDCDPEPLREGENRLWRNCRVRLAVGGGAARDRQLFGVIIERQGQFKFANYRTEF